MSQAQKPKVLVTHIKTPEAGLRVLREKLVHFRLFATKEINNNFKFQMRSHHM